MFRTLGKNHRPRYQAFLSRIMLVSSMFSYLGIFYGGHSIGGVWRINTSSATRNRTRTPIGWTATPPASGHTQAQQVGCGYQTHSCLGAALARSENRNAPAHALDLMAEYDVKFRHPALRVDPTVAGHANVFVGLGR
jgi:hypothetical protein